MEKVYNKLIRDKIPEIIEADNHEASVKTLSNEEFKEELSKKLIEEAKEVFEAENHEELIKELSDVQEVLMAIYKLNNIKCSEVTETGRKRREKRGAFEKKLFLISTKSRK